MKKISIIVPVYNTEKFLQKCLDSLINQTIINLLKIIIVNDGTKDNSEKIILKFLEKYPQHIEYYKKENGGLSSARNYGIKLCNTEYIGFVDSDDYIDERMFEKMYNNIKEKQCDIVSCGLIKIDKNNAIFGYEQTEETIYLDNNKAIEYFMNDNIKGYAWNKLYKTSLFKNNNIFYPEGRLYEDIITTYKLIKASKSIYLSSEPLYYYVMHKNSICANPNFKTAKDMLITLEEILEEGEKNQIFIANMLLASISSYYRWYYSYKENFYDKSKMKEYLKKVNYYKKQINTMNLIKNADKSNKFKMKYIAFNLNILKYIYLTKIKIENVNNYNIQGD